MRDTEGYRDGYAYEREHPTPAGEQATLVLSEASRRNAEKGDPAGYLLDFVAGAVDRYFEVNTL